MKTVLCIILYLLIGVLLGLAPVVINKGIFKYSNFYEYHEYPEEYGRYYEHDIEENASSFAIIVFAWPVLILIGLFVSLFSYIGESIMKLHKKTKNR